MASIAAKPGRAKTADVIQAKDKALLLRAIGKTVAQTADDGTGKAVNAEFGGIRRRPLGKPKNALNEPRVRLVISCGKDNKIH